MIREDILLPGTPFEHELESVPYAEVEDARGVKLESRVGRTTRDELTPLLATHRKGRHYASHDEYTPEVIHDNPVPAPGEVGCKCQEKNVDAVELS